MQCDVMCALFHTWRSWIQMPAWIQLCSSPINHPMYNALGACWGPTDKSSVQTLYVQNCFPACKTSSQKTLTCMLTRHEVNTSATMLEKAHMLAFNMTVRWTIKDKVLLVLHTFKRLANQAAPTHVNNFCPLLCFYSKTMTTFPFLAD